MPTPSSPLLPDERQAAGAARHATRYTGRFAPETGLGLLADSYGRPAEHARVRTHPVAPTERLTAERLEALAHTQGLTRGPTRVQFVCSHNAGRSRMAAALLAHRAGERVTVSSAGAHPAGEAAPHIAPAVPGRRYLDRPVADPDGAPIAVVRDIRDAVDAHVTELLTQLAP